MVSFSKPLPSLDLESTIRLLLILNNSIALSLGFAVMFPLFIVLGAVLAISALYNLFVILLRIRQKRPRWSDNNRDGDGEVRCPSIVQLAIDTLGVLAFLVLYVCSTIETATIGSWRWPPTMLMAYSSIGALVAFVMHGWVAVTNLNRYIRYRQSLGPRCPHCHQAISNFVGPQIALPPSPIEGCQGPAAPRQSFSANSAGENEGDTLIMKT
ncbi:hypothetical protein CLAIMM_10942 [Cladophialophora immunda]|nr:hypothetical protein CLAIMM_10942 [Cladophialophora immunda]